MCAALRVDSETAEWVAEKGDADGARELRRIWANAAGAEDQSPDPELLANPDMSVLRLRRRPPPALPLDVFGDAWRGWITANAESAACPPDYVVAPLLAAVSALIGNARWAQATPGWAEPPHLWCASVGELRCPANRPVPIRSCATCCRRSKDDDRRLPRPAARLAREAARPTKPRSSGGKAT